MNLSFGFDRIREIYTARHEPENVRHIADFLWRIMLVISSIAFVGILAYGAWEFIAVMEALYAPPPARAVPAPPLDRASLESALAQFEAREAAFAATSSAATVPDPSQ